jgi:hypothetical protein
MPTFSEYQDVELEMDIDPEDYVNSCSKLELKELVDILEDEGLVTRKSPRQQSRGYDAQAYEAALLKLSGNWNMLSAAESEFIVSLAKRF